MLTTASVTTPGEDILRTGSGQPNLTLITAPEALIRHNFIGSNFQFQAF